MPEGIITTIEDGFAVIDFIDPALRGPGLNRLIAAYGPEIIETLTRTGPRRLYRVPEGNAREVGLLDEGLLVSEPVPVAEQSESPNYDDGKPDADWHRGALDAYATKLGIDTHKLPNKGAVLAAIRAAEA